MVEAFFDGSDGKVFYRRWDPDGTPVRIVQIVHGYGEHGGRYAHVPYERSRRAVRDMPAVDRTEHLYDGARHELVNETNRDEVIGHLAAWIARVTWGQGPAETSATARHRSTLAGLDELPAVWSSPTVVEYTNAAPRPTTSTTNTMVPIGTFDSGAGSDRRPRSWLSPTSNPRAPPTSEQSGCWPDRRSCDRAQPGGSAARSLGSGRQRPEI
jgi:hypothetical protein